MDLLKNQGVVESTEGSYTFLKATGVEKFAVARATQTPGDAEISLWFNKQDTVRQIRRAIVRQRFQNEFSKEMPWTQFSEKKFNLSFSEFRARLLEGFLTENGPTLGEFPQTYLDFLDSYDVLGELAPKEAEEYLDLIDERYLEHSFVRGACRFLPFGCSYSYLVCNRELFREAGVDPDEEFKSWSDFAEKCEQLKKTYGAEALQVSENGLFWLLSQWIYQADSSLPEKGRLPLIDWQGEAARVGMKFLIEMIFERKLIRVINSCRLAQTSPFLAGQVPIALEEIMLSVALELDQTEAFTIKAFPPGPGGSPLSLMNTVGWVADANSSIATQRRAGEYILSWEKWLHVGEGGAAMRRLGVAPSLTPLLKDPCKDRFYSEKLPSDWRRTFHSLKEYGRWEASDSDLVSRVLTPILLSKFQTEDAPPCTNTLLKHLMLAQYDAGILDFHSNQKP